eukprot:scaffold114677_cov38-Prasinocladus_malaysianus.AAC.5
MPGLPLAICISWADIASQYRSQCSTTPPPRQRDTFNRACSGNPGVRIGHINVVCMPCRTAKNSEDRSIKPTHTGLLKFG